MRRSRSRCVGQRRQTRPPARRPRRARRAAGLAAARPRRARTGPFPLRRRAATPSPVVPARASGALRAERMIAPRLRRTAACATPCREGSDGMAERPVAVLAMAPRADGGSLRTRQSARASRALATCPTPSRSRASTSRAPTRSCARAEILLTGWGCAAASTPTVLARAPRLRAIVHAAGTVKGHVDPACFERGVRVASAAPRTRCRSPSTRSPRSSSPASASFRLQRRYRELRGFRLWWNEVPPTRELPARSWASSALRTSAAACSSCCGRSTSSCCSTIRTLRADEARGPRRASRRARRAAARAPTS